MSSEGAGSTIDYGVHGNIGHLGQATPISTQIIDLPSNDIKVYIISKRMKPLTVIVLLLLLV